MRYNRNLLLRRFKGLSHQETLSVDMLVMRHDKLTQLRIISNVVRYLEDRIGMLEDWHIVRDRRYSNRECLDAELALKCEKQLSEDIRLGRIDAEHFRQNFSKLGVLGVAA